MGRAGRRARFRCVPAQGAHEGRPYRGRGYWWDAGWADQGRTAGEVSVRPRPGRPRGTPLQGSWILVGRRMG